MKTFNITKKNDGSDNATVINTYYSLEDAHKALDNMAANIDDDTLVWIDNEEDAREWLAAIANDEDQEERAEWLRGVIASGVYGLYRYDGGLEYQKGDDTWYYDVYTYAIEEA
mgnify:CR=1 FL=1